MIYIYLIIFKVYRTEKERIKAALKENSLYESWPLPDPNKSFELRPRQPSKELFDAKIRYQPKHLIERVRDTVANNSMLFVDDNNRSFSTLGQTNRSFTSKNNLKSHYPSFVLGSKRSKDVLSKNSSNKSPKSILPHLHVKTHYKGATTFTLAYPGSFYCPTTKNADKAVARAKSDREKVSQRNLFNAFRNIESNIYQFTNNLIIGSLNGNSTKQKLRMTGTLTTFDEPLTDISMITKNVLKKCNVFRK